MYLDTRKRNPIILDTAVLKIKTANELDFINNTFAKVIQNKSNCIRIDFGNGNSFMEETFPKKKEEIQKIFLEFFDLDYQEDIMDYLVSDKSNFRATSMDGTIVRPSIEDYDYVMEYAARKVKQKRKGKN